MNPLTPADKAKLNLMWVVLIVFPAISTLLLMGASYVDSLPAGEVTNCEVTQVEKKVIQDIPVKYVHSSCGTYTVTNFLNPPDIEVGQDYTFTLKGMTGRETIAAATLT